MEYASAGQDEDKLQDKIADLLAAGTRWVWVVRLLGPRRVEVYEGGRPARTFGPGTMLSAPGILRNDVPVEALYDRSLAHELTLRNLLQRKGYEGLDDVRDEGRIEALQRAVRAVLAARGFTLDASHEEVIAACRDLPALEQLLRRAAIAPSVAAVFDLPAEPAR